MSAFVGAWADALGGPGAATQEYRELFREGRTRRLAAASPDLAGRIAAPIESIHRSESPEGEVVKFVQRLDGMQREGTRGDASIPHLDIESVVIPMIGRRGVPSHTLCVSSQVGCAMGCTFCETAQMGLVRSLAAHEIVGQWFAARHTLGARPKNIVFMGMGEPLDNLDEVLKAIEVLTDHNAAAVPMTNITVSTVGRIDGLRRLIDRINQPGWHRLQVAVSLNAPNDRIRSQIMPINRAMPMGELREAMLALPAHGSRKIMLGYVLIPGVNDAPEHARELAEYVTGVPCCVNVIPYNPRRDSPWPAPTEPDVANFIESLLALGVYAKRRRTKGRDMMGACGQLGSAEIRRRRFIGLTGVGAAPPAVRPVERAPGSSAR